MVFGNFVVDEAHNIGTNWSLENSWKANGSLGGFVLLRVNGDLGTGRGQRLKWKKQIIYYLWKKPRQSYLRLSKRAKVAADTMKQNLVSLAASLPTKCKNPGSCHSNCTDSYNKYPSVS